MALGKHTILLQDGRVQPYKQDGATPLGTQVVYLLESY